MIFRKTFRSNEVTFSLMAKFYLHTIMCLQYLPPNVSHVAFNAVWVVGIKEWFGTLLQHKHFHWKVCYYYLSYALVVVPVTYHISNGNIPSGSSTLVRSWSSKTIYDQCGQDSFEQNLGLYFWNDNQPTYLQSKFQKNCHQWYTKFW